MRLCTAADVKARKKSLPNVAAIDTAIEDAIDGATFFLEGKLNTSFDRASLTHTYRINEIENPPTGSMNELFLKSAMIQGSPVPTVQTAFKIEDLSSAEQLVIDKDFHVNPDEGLIFLDHKKVLQYGQSLIITGGYSPNELFARVTYTAGMTDTAGLFDDVPPWLVEAAVVTTILIMEFGSKITKVEHGDQLTPKNQTAWHHLRGVINKHGRSFGSAIKPLF